MPHGFREGSPEAILLESLEKGDERGLRGFVDSPYLRAYVRKAVAALDRAEAMRWVVRGGNACLAALSEHPDGWVREAAIRALQPDASSSLLALLRRANDWVPVVARLAGQRAAAELGSAEDRTLLEVLPLVFALTRQSRADHRGLVYAYLREVEGRAGLAKRVRRAYRNGPVGEWAAARIAGAGESLAERQQETLDAGPPKAQLETARRLAPQPGMWRKLMDSPNAHVRRIALDHAPLEAIEAALTDPNARVRNDARYLLSGRDVASYYRERLPEPGAVSGLGETGTRDDAARLRALLTFPEADVRGRALEALFRLEGDAAEADLWTGLRDPSRKVQRVAAESLVRSNLALDPEVTVSLDLGSGVKRMLLDRAPRWAALNAALGQIDRLSGSGGWGVEVWIARWVAKFWRGGLRPSSGAIRETQSLLERTESRLKPETAAALREAVAYASR